ncbi:hypothetical protein V6N13_005069 [Hibiscus sabdariffa]
MKKRFSDLTLNVILRTVAGKRYSSVSKEEKQVVSRYRKALRDFFYLSGIFVIGDAVPFLRKLDLGGYEKWMKKTAKELDDVVAGADLAGYDADTINKATSLNMILAGSDTTRVTLIWALSLLLNKPHLLKKAQEELDIHVGKDIERRSCPRTSFALQMLHLTLSNFLHVFEFSRPDNGLIDLTGTVGLTDMKSTPLEALVSPRLAPQLYGMNDP